MKKNIAPHILFSEYKCNHCRRLPPDFYSEDGGVKSVIPVIYQEFFGAYEKFRVPWGRGINWTSGYRCPYWNEKSGGSDFSVHIFGLAGDLACKNNDELEGLYQCILTFSPELRLGKYRQKGDRKPFIHFDIGYEIIPRLSKKWHKMARW